MSKNDLFAKKLKAMIQAAQMNMQEMSIRIENLDRGYKVLFDELGTTPEELNEHLNNPENFSKPIWEQLQNEKQAIQDKLNADINSVPDTSKVKKSFEERKHIQPHWIPVR